MKHTHLLALGVASWLVAACASSEGGTAPDANDAQACQFDEDCVDDGLFCNGSFVCRQGQCQATDPPNCADSLACTVDSCDEDRAGCINVPMDDLCDEGFVCNQLEGCSIPPVCEFDSECQDDSFVCNGAPKCIDNECINEPLDCDDMMPCTADECVEGTGCVNTPYDNQNDPEACGASCDPCPDPGPLQVNTHKICVLGACGLECDMGYWDVNMDLSDGCEVACPTDPLTTPDIPDDLFQDQNCDGIDGTAADGIFVSENGSNANPGTKQFPVKTITFGLNKAEADGKSFVYISAGNYSETVTLKNGIGLYGGYLHSSNWLRDGTRAVITGPRTGALRATDITTTTIVEYLRFESAKATSPSTSSHAAVFVNSDGVKPRYLTLIGGDGAGGQQGNNAGSAGDDGGDGTPGTNGYEDDGYWYCAGNVTDPPTSYAGGSSCTGGTYDTRGGTGGRQCKTNSSSGCAGVGGGGGWGPPGVGGGGGGTAVNGGAGGHGTAGSSGDPGIDGSGGSGGYISSNQWVPRNGNPGGKGEEGRGGGGGAGGGSNHSTGTCNDWGGGGGGGGGGGCGGTGGDAGTGGGASIGLLLINSDITAEYVDVTAGKGGNGGAGRDGGSGGPGGLGRTGGAGYDEGRAGGNGRNGGSGGRGGHGGGGAGGWSICVYVNSSSSFDDSAAAGTMSPGGIGSGGGSSGNGGTAGSSVSVHNE